MVRKTCRWLFSVELVFAALIPNVWLLHPGSLEETLSLLSMRKDFVAMFHIRLTCNLVRAPVRPTSQDADRPRMSLRRSLPIELFMLVLT